MLWNRARKLTFWDVWNTAILPFLHLYLINHDYVHYSPSWWFWVEFVYFYALDYMFSLYERYKELNHFVDGAYKTLIEQ